MTGTVQASFLQTFPQTAPLVFPRVEALWHTQYSQQRKGPVCSIYTNKRGEKRRISACGGTVQVRNPGTAGLCGGLGTDLQYSLNHQWFLSYKAQNFNNIFNIAHK